MAEELKNLKVNLTVDVLQAVAAEYRRVIEKDNRDWHFHYKYGKLLAEDLKDYGAAAEQYRLVQSYFPHSYMGYNALGSVFRGLGDLDRAIDQFLKAIQIKPTCVEAHYYLAWVYRRQGRADKAIEYYAKTLRIMPKHARAHFNWGLTLQEQGKLESEVKWEPTL